MNEIKNTAILESFLQKALFNFLPHAVELLFLFVSGVIVFLSISLLKKHTQARGVNLMFYSYLLTCVFMLLGITLPFLFDDAFHMAYWSLLGIPLSIAFLIGFYQFISYVVTNYDA